ncbi:TadE-like protein [Azoarcus sp. Aa7]|nr:TadE-like protein [Azoarcus sp. Aa7]
MDSLAIGKAARQRQGGVAAVEFALLVFLMLLICAGIVEFGRAVWHYDALAKATRDGARYMSTISMPALATASATAEDLVVTAATAAGVPNFTAADVTVTCAPTACASAAAPGNVTRVIVDVSYSMTLGIWFPFISRDGKSGFDITLTPHTTMPYMR